MSFSSVKTLTADDFDNICRICLEKDNLCPIHFTYINDKKVSEVLEDSVRSDVKDETLPQNICEKCLKNLFKTCTFRKQCQDVEAILKKILKISKNEETKPQINEINNTNFEESKKSENQNKPKNLIPAKRIFQCETCGKKFSCHRNLKLHNMLHTGERPLMCRFCGRRFIWERSLLIHERSHKTNEPGSFQCQICGLGFKRSRPFDAHMQKHAPKSETTQSVKTNTPRDHICEICGRGYTAKHILMTHRLTHERRSLLCYTSGKGFYTNGALEAHSRTHAGVKPYVCSICRKEFTTSTGLELHMRIHTGFKPYKCNVCLKGFVQRGQWVGHMRTHTGERPYGCPHCDKQFALKTTLTQHMKRHTGEKPYSCSVCGRNFADRRSMRRHDKNIHGKVKKAESSEKLNTIRPIKAEPRMACVQEEKS